MSLEVKIEALTASVNQLIAVMSAAQQSVPAAPVVQASGYVAPNPAPVAPAPVVAAPQMPALPTFAPAPAPAAPVSTAPFTNAQGVMEYTMGAYKAMGPEKGNKIQGILQGMGVANLNDLKPEQYGPFHQAVEALKVS
jgi:hypothetical protein